MAVAREPCCDVPGSTTQIDDGRTVLGLLDESPQQREVEGWFARELLVVELLRILAVDCVVTRRTTSVIRLAWHGSSCHAPRIQAARGWDRLCSLSRCSPAYQPLPRVCPVRSDSTSAQPG